MALFAGGLAALAVISPFMAGFSQRAASTPVRWVPTAEHTPIARFWVMHWPLLCLAGLSLFAGRCRRLAITFAAIWVGLLLMSEWIFIDDSNAAQYQRTNTTMKWWGWIHAGALITSGALCLASARRWVRWSALAVVLALNVIVFDLARYWIYSGKYGAGKLHGHQWYTWNATNRQMIEYLRASPDGIVLENVLGYAYTNTSVYGLFAEKPVLLGWPAHLTTWHGEVPRVWLLYEEIQQFYQGEKQDPLPWLLAHQVRYIVFRPEDDDRQFEKIHQRIQSHYAWHEFNHARDRRIGIWVRYDD